MKKKKFSWEEKKFFLEEKFFFFLPIKVFFTFLHFLCAGLHLVTTEALQMRARCFIPYINFGNHSFGFCQNAPFQPFTCFFSRDIPQDPPLGPHVSGALALGITGFLGKALYSGMVSYSSESTLYHTVYCSNPPVVVYNAIPVNTRR